MTDRPDATTRPISMLGRRARRLSNEMAALAARGNDLAADLVALERHDGRDRSEAVIPLRNAMVLMTDAHARLAALFDAVAEEEEQS